ncbi:MAG: hypothetical protein IJT27_04140 [Clostridia bacterium]|nr:hypothetical protein [Clostridia bacterium]
MKKALVVLMALILALAVFAACGKQDGGNQDADTPASDDATVDVASFKTLGEALALDETGESQSATYEDCYVYVLEQNGTYWRLTAALTADQSAALWELDILDENYNEQLEALISPLAITNCENLNDQLLSEDERNALVGKTGEDLLADGWTSGYGYNLDSMEFYLEKGPFCYTVVFESEEQLENTDDFDELEAIRTLAVKSVAFNSLGNSATDLPEE